jgi:tetratricopeptide (TPR) repeat protein
MDFDAELDVFQTAENHFNNNEYALAEPILNQLVLKNSKRAEVYHMLGTIYYDQGKFNKAIRSFRRALEINPSFTDSSIGLSIILNDLGRYDEGQKVFDEARTMLATKNNFRDSSVEERFSVKHDELGELYLRHSRVDEALEQFRKAYGMTQLRRPEIGTSIGECLILKNQIPLAIKEFRQLTKEYPHYVPALLKLGKCFYDLQQIPEAIDCWEKVLAFEKNNKIALDYLRLAQSVHLTNINSPEVEL